MVNTSTPPISCNKTAMRTTKSWLPVEKGRDVGQRTTKFQTENRNKSYGPDEHDHKRRNNWQMRTRCQAQIPCEGLWEATINYEQGKKKRLTRRHRQQGESMATEAEKGPNNNNYRPKQQMQTSCKSTGAIHKTNRHQHEQQNNTYLANAVSDAQAESCSAVP